MKWLSQLLLVGGTLLVGCGDEENPHEGIESWACETMADADAQATAAAAPGDTAPTVMLGRAYDVALVALASQNGGDLSFEVSAGRHLVFVSDDIPVALVDGAGDVLPIDNTENPFEHCEQVAAEYRYVLEAGEATVRFGPTPAESVRLLLAEDAASY